MSTQPRSMSALPRSVSVLPRSSVGHLSKGAQLLVVRGHACVHLRGNLGLYMCPDRVWVSQGKEAKGLRAQHYPGSQEEPPGLLCLLLLSLSRRVSAERSTLSGVIPASV